MPLTVGSRIYLPPKWLHAADPDDKALREGSLYKRTAFKKALQTNKKKTASKENKTKNKRRI